LWNISFFEVNDRPYAIPMKPKMVAITCPIFFTDIDVNLARVRNLHKKLGEGSEMRRKVEYVLE